MPFYNTFYLEIDCSNNASKIFITNYHRNNLYIKSKIFQQTPLLECSSLIFSSAIEEKDIFEITTLESFLRNDKFLSFPHLMNARINFGYVVYKADANKEMLTEMLKILRRQNRLLEIDDVALVHLKSGYIQSVKCDNGERCYIRVDSSIIRKKSN